jgi:Uma2 family endonuclease
MKTLLHLTPDDHGRSLTLEEFEHAVAREGFRYELIDGRLNVSPAPNLPHEDLVRWLRRILERYADDHSEIVNCVQTPARVFVPGADAVTAPEPDLAIYHDYPQRRLLRERRWQDVTPVLVVEVLSEDNAEKDLERNRELYLRVPSIREYWMLDPRQDPDQPSLTVLRRRGRRWQQPVVVAAGRTYTTRLLPEFVLRIDPHA